MDPVRCPFRSGVEDVDQIMEIVMETELMSAIRD